MNILFVGEDLNKSRSGVVTVMNQILNDDNLKNEIQYVPIFTTSDDYSTLRKLYSWFKAYVKFLYHIKSCDMVHIHHASDLNFWLSSGMVKIANFFDKKSVLHNHSADFHEFYNKNSENSKRKICEVFENATANVVLSNNWLNWYKSIAPKADWFMVQNAIEIPRNIAQKQITEKEVILIYLARIEKRKGFFDLMEVMPSIIQNFPFVKLYVAGQGDIEKAHEIVKEFNLNNNVIILGHIDSAQRDKYLRMGHFLIFPSYNEGLPMSLLEAMSYGLVPITTPVGGIPDVVIHGKNGMLIDAGDTKDLAKNLEEILNSPNIYETMSRNARIDIDRDFNYKNYGEKLKKVYAFMEANKRKEV